MAQRPIQRTLFIDVDPGSLEMKISFHRVSAMTFPAQLDDSVDLPPMWEAVCYHHIYAEYHRHQERLPVAERALASLAHPPFWLVAIGSLMWEGIIQGFAWDFIKIATRKAFPKLSEHDNQSGITRLSIRGGFETFAKDGRRQYGMYLNLKRAIEHMPHRHALAYARAANTMEFGEIIRGKRVANEPKRNDFGKKLVGKRRPEKRDD